MSLWLPTEPLILASQSKVRRALLEAAGIPVEARPAHLDESALVVGVRAVAMLTVNYLAAAKRD